MQSSALHPGPTAGGGRSAPPAERDGGLRHLSYPLLRRNTPLLRRTPSELQIGVDEGALIVAHANRAFERLLAMLDGCHHVNDIRRQAQQSAVAPNTLQVVLDRLQSAGLLSEGRRGSDPTTPGAIRLVGAGHVGRAVAELLVGSEVSHLELVDDVSVDSSVYPGHAQLGTKAAALRTVLERHTVLEESTGLGGMVGRATQSATSIVVGRTSAIPGPGEGRGAGDGRIPVPMLTVVATDWLEPDRLVADALLRADQPHLLVRASAAGMDVGPLVLPGETACVRCTDLARRDLDPAWHILLPQLCRSRATLVPALVGWAAGVAVTQVLGFLAGQRPESAGATIELSAHDFATRLRVWNAHPDCGCGLRFSAQ